MADTSTVAVTKQNIPYLLAEAKKHVAALSGKSRIFDEERENSFPRLKRSELDLGRILGSGGFCEVKEISKIKLEGPLIQSRYEKEEEDRAFLSNHVIRNGDSRYAIKTLGPHIRNDAVLYMKGAIDLAIEARFLAVVENPFIIRMRALSEGSPYSDGFFIVLDRLYGTLEDKIAEWEKTESKTKGIVSMISGKSKKKKAQGLLKRLVVAFDICNAMLHFHRNNIIYRDLKPENIGFDVRDDVKVFDLGLAKELLDEDMLADGTWNLTGMTGSLRYMAPEVAQEKPYNYTADVYSFAILLWQLLSLKTPFDRFGVSIFNELVVEKGYRPDLEKKWPASIQDLIKMCWSKDMKRRLQFEDMVEILRGEISGMSGEDANDIDVSRRTARSG